MNQHMTEAAQKAWVKYANASFLTEQDDTHNIAKAAFLAGWIAKREQVVAERSEKNSAA